MPNFVQHVDVHRVLCSGPSVVGVAHTRDFLPEEIGRTAQIECTATAVGR